MADLDIEQLGLYQRIPTSEEARRMYEDKGADVLLITDGHIVERYVLNTDGLTSVYATNPYGKLNESGEPMGFGLSSWESLDSLAVIYDDPNDEDKIRSVFGRRVEEQRFPDLPTEESSGIYTVPPTVDRNTVPGMRLYLGRPTEILEDLKRDTVVGKPIDDDS